MNHKCHRCNFQWKTKNIPLVDMPKCPVCKKNDLVESSIFEIK